MPDGRTVGSSHQVNDPHLVDLRVLRDDANLDDQRSKCDCVSIELDCGLVGCTINMAHTQLSTAM